MLRKFLFSLIAIAGLLSTAQTPRNWEGLESDITFIVSNDNGRNGYYDQKTIAATMGAVADAIGPEVVIALGDVFHYQGVQSVNDPIWISNYESIYNHPELMIDWMPILGNHEYRGNTRAVQEYSAVSRRWCMPAKYYSRSFKEDNTSVKVILLDTTPLIDKYRKDTEKYPDAGKEDVEAQLQWLEKELAGATEDWIIVGGHHPIYADTDKSAKERTDMQKRVDKILRKHKVDMYICGHIHNFQHIKPEGSDIDYVVNSSASLSRENVKAIDGTVFTGGQSGFSVIGASPEQLTLSMLDKDGNIIYQLKRTAK